MTLKQIDAILWRNYLGETSKAVWGDSNSQWYFEMPDRGYEDFFNGNCTEFVDKDGNRAFKITLQCLDDEEGVAKHEVTIAQKRLGSLREGTWTVDSIRDGSGKAYELWRKGRGPIARYGQLPPEEEHKNYIVIVRDTDGLFHGRWIRGSDFDSLPELVKKTISSENAGWRTL